MRQRSVSVSQHMVNHLRKVNLLLPICLSIVACVGFATISLWHYFSEARLVISAIKKHVASLVEAQDRPELQRLLMSARNERNVDLLVIQDGIVVGSTRSNADLDMPLQDRFVATGHNSIRIHDFNFELIESVTPENGADLNTEILYAFPLWHPLALSLGTGVLALLLGLGIGRLYSHLSRGAVVSALKPLDALSEAIESLVSSAVVPEIQPVGIVELDKIGNAVCATQTALLATRDRLAAAQAKEMAADAYRRLIHDLHTPVSALRKLTRIADLDPDDEAIQRETRESTVRLTDQILGQLSAASKTLEFENPRMIAQDLRLCISEAVGQVTLLAEDRTPACVIEQRLPDEAVLFSHDRVLLGRAVTNLLKNAVEAGASRITVSLFPLGEDEALIRVRDNGPGMEEAHVSLCLKGRGKSSKGERFGLGLATVNHILRLHGGRVVHSSPQGGGSVFELRLAMANEASHYNPVTGETNG